MKRAKPEKYFELELVIIAHHFKCSYEKIKDTRSINKYNRNIHREVQRLCDGLLVTPNGIFMIECKVDYARLKPHQSLTQNRVNSIYKGYFVLRKRIYTSKKKWGKVEYFIEQPEMYILFSTDKIEEIIKYFLKGE
ncbi:MAG: hypothetical protein KAT68_19600 [Bacteroidales bacterium]|nr:hypothetical protein [Bacteroidales bacterium]